MLLIYVPSKGLEMKIKDLRRETYAIQAFGKASIGITLPKEIIEKLWKLSKGDLVHISGTRDDTVILISKKKLPETVELTGLPANLID